MMVTRMKYDGILKLEKTMLEENSKRIAQKDMDWMMKKVADAHPEWDALGDKTQREVYILRQVNMFCRGIVHEKPADVRAYVTGLMKAEGYRQRFRTFSDELLRIRPGDSRACDALAKRLSKFEDDAERELPGFRENYAYAISELRGHILAVKTKGAAGSTRMTAVVRDKETEEEINKALAKRKPEDLLKDFEEDAEKLEAGQRDEARRLSEAYRVFISLAMKKRGFFDKNEGRIKKVADRIAEKART